MIQTEEAQRFLTLLGEGTEQFTFQTFDDVILPNGDKRKDGRLAKWVVGDLDSQLNLLQQNSAQGAGVYVAVQDMDGLGRSSHNVRTIRAVFQEDDGDGKELPLQPHIVVNTSPGKYHRYILVEGLNRDEFEAVLDVIVTQYGSDKNAKDVARVLRLPGFPNNKYSPPYPVSIFHESGEQPYKAKTVLDAFGIKEVKSRERVRNEYDGEALYVTDTQIKHLRQALTFLDADDGSVWIRAGLCLKTIGNVGFDLWYEWSKTSYKWNEKNYEQWKTFKPEQLTYRSIFHDAEQLGWINPMRNDAPNNDPEEDLFADLKAIFVSELPDKCEFPDELVEGLLVRNEFSILYGDSNSGKTFFAIDIACAIALGVDWMKRRTEQGLVVYLASESPSSVRLRLQAYERHHKVSLGDNILIVQAPVNFYQTEMDVKRLIKLLNKVSQITGKRIELIIGDTLARISAGANENAGEDMGQVMERFDKVKDAVNAHIMIISHSGKDATKGLRGWSGIKAHVDTEIEVKVKDSVRIATVTKQRGLPSKGDQIFFDLEVITMGKTKWGQDATTCIVSPLSAQDIPPKNSYSWETRILVEAWLTDGQVVSGSYPYVQRKTVRKCVEADKPNATTKTIDNSMVRFKKLASDGLLEEYNNGWRVIDGMLSAQLFVLQDN